MRIQHAVATFVLSLLAPTVARAQHLLPGPAAPPIANDDLSRLITGEFSGNTHLDAVVLANGKPTLRESVETYETYVQADLTATDIARLAGGGSQGQDRVVAVGPGGLSLLELAEPPSTPPWSVSTLRGPGTYWTGAIAVRVAQVDGQDGEDIVAVTSTRVVITYSDGNGGWTSDFSFVAGAGITGVELVDWDREPGGELEVVLLLGPTPTLPARLRVMKRTGGTPIQTISSSGDRIIAAPVSAAGLGPRWLAAISIDDSETGSEDLVLLADDHVAGPWSLAVTGSQAIVAGDWTGDGLDDLVVSTTTSRDASLYVMTNAGPDAITVHSLDLPPSLPVALPVGHPLRNVAVQDGGISIADVDHDTDLDLVSAVQGDYDGSPWQQFDSRFSAVVCTLNDDEREVDWLPWHAPGTPWPPQLPPPVLPRDTGVLTVRLQNPVHVIPEAQFECAVWRTPTIEALAIPTPVVAPDPLAIGLENDGNGFYWSTLDLPLDQHEDRFADRYTLIVRQVKRDAADKIVAQSPALKLTFFSPLDADEYSVGWTVQTNDVLVDPDKPEEPGGTTGGAGVPPTPPDQRP